MSEPIPPEIVSSGSHPYSSPSDGRAARSREALPGFSIANRVDDARVIAVFITTLMCLCSTLA